ncbi:MAG TPA: laccase domain-containing protein, partial [Blastocatellia bacterium]|nr:laccase domain-containing protein [Blastocatellia bacterium]
MDDPSNNEFSLRRKDVDTPTGKVTISYVVCEAIDRAGFKNAFSTRTGGLSAFPSSALNLGFFGGDTTANVTENRRRFLEAIGAGPARIVTGRQTHSTKIRVIESAKDARAPEQGCDALVTREAGVLLGVHTADCLPVIIA